MMKWFLSYSKNYTANLWKPVNDITNFPTFIYPIESGKCAKKGKKLQKAEYFQKKGLFRLNNKSFS